MTQAGDTTQTNLQSSNQQSQSQAGTGEAGDGSSHTPTRPEYIPETFWDASANAVKGKDFADHLTQLSALKAEHDARLAARPEKPDGYQLAFPKDFTPEIPIAFDAADPRVSALREFGHKRGWTQDDFSEALTIEAARVVSEHKAFQAAEAAEKQKLGANGTARVTALKTFLTGMLGAQAAVDLLGDEKNPGLVVFSAKSIEHLEKLQQAVTRAAGGNFSQQHREHASGEMTDEDYDKLTPSEKLAYARRPKQRTGT